MSEEPRPEGTEADASGEPHEPEAPAGPDAPTARPPAPPATQEWTSPGWSPPGPTPQTAAPGPAPQPGPGYPQTPPPGYPPQHSQTPPPGYPPAYSQTPPPAYPPQYRQSPPPGYPPQYGRPAQPSSPAPQPGPAAPAEGWYPQQPHYAPGWQAPVGPPPRTGRRGTRIALGVIAGIAAVALVVGGVVGGRYWLETRPLGEVTTPMTVHAGRLSTGHCLASLPADGTVRSVRVVPCSDPHVAEVVGARPLSGTSWPGAQQVTTELEKWCEMDTAEQDLGLRPVVWGPTEQGWNQGDRTGLCLAWLPSGTMRGSFTANEKVTAP